MNKYVAKLTGESDGHIVVLEFGDFASAIAWMQGAGLADFEDQTACGEVRSTNGDVIWRKSNLQSVDRAARNEKVDWKRFFARHNFTFKDKERLRGP
jgi:hypothetical protein